MLKRSYANKVDNSETNITEGRTNKIADQTSELASLKLNDFKILFV